MRLLSKENGSVMIMVGIALVVFFGFAALAIDGGYLYYKKAQLQGIADAAALAAGKEYEGTNQSIAITKAISYAEKNGLTVTYPDPSGSHTAVIQNASGEEGYMDVLFPDTNIKVIMNLECQNFFAQVIGSDSSDVAASATVGTGILGSFGRGILPLGVEEGSFQTGQSYKLSDSPGEGSSGNYLFLNLDSYLPPESTETNNAGTTNFNEYLATGYDGDYNFEVGGSLKTVTGQNTGPVDQAIEDRIDDGNTIVTLPLIRPFSETDPHGTSDRIEIIGFVEFEITRYVKEGNERYIEGMFLRRIDVGPLASGSTSYSVRAVRLID